jgi:hypothetical protein
MTTIFTPNDVSLAFLDALTSIEHHISSLKEDFISYDLFSNRNDDDFSEYRKAYYSYLTSINKVFTNTVSLFEANCKLNNFTYED